MFPVAVRLVVISAVILAVVLGGVAGPVTAQEADEEEQVEEDQNRTPELKSASDVVEQVSLVDKAAATRVRKAFLTAKKAFHEARQELQAIKKGDESPVEDVPTFFDSEE